MDAVEKCIESKDRKAFKAIFSLSVAENVSELDIEKVFDLFPSGITYQATDSEDYAATYESKRGDNYQKNLEWHKEFIDNATQKEYVMIINICTENWDDESAIGMKFIIFYNVEQEEAALEWVNSAYEEEIFEGVHIYGE